MTLAYSISRSGGISRRPSRSFAAPHRTTSPIAKAAPPLHLAISSSTRRLRCLPSGLSLLSGFTLGATGRVAPKPCVRKIATSKPSFWTSQFSTATARCLNSNPNFNRIIPTCNDYITPDGKCVDPKTVRFVQAPLGKFGNAGRNILTGPPSANFDVSLSKSFRFGERLWLQLRGDAYDLLNRQNPGPLAGNPYIASAQQVRAIAFDPARLANNGLAVESTPARVNGVTPENATDAVEFAPANKSFFLNQKFLTTSSRRMQLSLKLTF